MREYLIKMNFTERFLQFRNRPHQVRGPKREEEIFYKHQKDEVRNRAGARGAVRGETGCADLSDALPALYRAGRAAISFVLELCAQTSCCIIEC